MKPNIKEDLARDLLENLHHLQGKHPEHATRNDWYMALVYAVRARIMDRYIATLEAIHGASIPTKVVAYFSAEFLVGPHLGNALISLDLVREAEAAVAAVGH